MINRLVRLFIQDCDNVTDPAVREKYGVLSGAVGIVLNLLLSAGKFFAGVVTGSIAITADAFNNLSDAGSSVVTLVGFKLAGQKADDGHPFGHGRAEYLAGLLVSLMMLLVGLELGKTSIGKILRPEAVDFSLVSVAILAASILVKLWMSHFNRVLGKKLGSAAMAATAADSLSDVVATSAVLAGTLAPHRTPMSCWWTARRWIRPPKSWSCCTIWPPRPTGSTPATSCWTRCGASTTSVTPGQWTSISSACGRSWRASASSGASKPWGVGYKFALNG